MNYVLAWLTLRCNSVIPAAIAHAVSNTRIESHVNTANLWTGEWRIVLWAVAALVLFRYWPMKGEADSGPNPLQTEQAVV